MEFGFELVDSTQKLERWNRITIAGQSGPLQAWQGKSAPWLLRTFGPCRLYVCFFTFYGEERPAIVVPIYVREPCAIAQGITRLQRNCPSNSGPLATLLLARVCEHFAESVRWLFISPISRFRTPLLAFLAEHKVRHGDLGTDSLKAGAHRVYPEGATWVDVEEDEDGLSHCTLVVRPKRDSKQTSMTWDPHVYPPPAPFHLGVVGNGPIDQWSVVHQRWLSVRRRDAHREDDEWLRAHAPFNFLSHLCGAGIIIIDAQSLALAADGPKA
jgi:hypothetical protein